MFFFSFLKNIIISLNTLKEYLVEVTYLLFTLKLEVKLQETGNRRICVIFSKIHFQRKTIKMAIICDVILEQSNAKPCNSLHWSPSHTVDARHSVELSPEQSSPASNTWVKKKIRFSYTLLSQLRNHIAAKSMVISCG